MANDVTVYLIDEKVLEGRMLQLEDGSSVNVRDWLSQGQESADVWHYLLQKSWHPDSIGVHSPTYFRRGVGDFPDLERLLPLSEVLQKRMRILEMRSINRHDVIPIYPHSESADFPTDYHGWLTVLNYPGWQFFSRVEMDALLAKVMANIDQLAFQESWRELDTAHRGRTYNLALFTHEL